MLLLSKEEDNSNTTQFENFLVKTILTGIS